MQLPSERFTIRTMMIAVVIVAVVVGVIVTTDWLYRQQIAWRLE
jgi:hypothetical protein